MLAVLVEFKIRVDKALAFADAIQANAQQSLAQEPGCHRFDVCRDPADPTTFLLYELYTDSEAFAAHLRMPHYLAMSAQTASWVDHKQVRQLHLLE